MVIMDMVVVVVLPHKNLHLKLAHGLVGNQVDAFGRNVDD